MEKNEAFAQDALLNFITKAKQLTYASGDEKYKVAPALESSKQFEFAEDDFFYRDIYYGTSFIVGQETVFVKNVPTWSMTYSGGLAVESHPQAERAVFMFLKEALKKVRPECPLRGPKEMTFETFKYKNEVLGHLGRFCGLEQIFFEDQEVYQLHYIGGLIK